MPQKKGPQRLFDRFNLASKAVLGAAALSLMAAAPVAAGTENMQAPFASAANQQSSAYEYLGDRTIRISGAINKATALDVIQKLYELSEADPDADIEIRLNSGGGSVTDGFAIYDVMKSLPNDIRTVCEGEAQSMAAFLLSAGTQGKRYSYPNCTIMYHQPSWGTTGQVTNMDIVTSKADQHKDRMIEIIAEDTGWSEDVVRDLLERNFYPTPEEAQEMGFVDHIIEEQNPDTTPAPKTKLPDGFCDSQGRQHMYICKP